MKAAIDLNDVAFTWQGRTQFTLTVPNLTVPAGEKLFLLGQSGSGKSTLLSLICGITQPQQGTIAVDGVDLSTLRPSARDRFRAERIGVIFQMFNLLPYASPLENILLQLSFAPERRKRLENPQEEALRLTTALGLDRDLVLNAQTSELSIGQQQRVAAARALIGRPRLIVADEPTSSLDANSQDAFLDLLMQQCDEAGANLLMVSHDARLAQSFDRTLDLADIAHAERRVS